MQKIQIITRNNEKTIEKTLKSIVGFDVDLIDLESTDRTIEIAKKFKVNISIKTKDINRSILRQKTIQDSTLVLEPFETLIQGNDFTKTNVKIVQGDIITKENRIYHDNDHFVNPIFETLVSKNNSVSDVIIYSTGLFDFNYYLDRVNNWLENQPTKIEAYYYKANLMFSKQDYKEFIKLANYYFFLNKEANISATMLRYFYAFTKMLSGEFKESLQNINICLSRNPLMAEFWCLMGDIYWSLLKRPREAIEFYENAIFLGTRRKDDEYPIYTKKYKEYPEKMISLLNKI